MRTYYMKLNYDMFFHGGNSNDCSNIANTVHTFHKMFKYSSFHKYVSLNTIMHLFRVQCDKQLFL